MNRQTLITIAGVVLIALAGGVLTRSLEPIVGLPGGQLSGTEAPAPPDWAAARDLDTVQLETRLDEPYSVNVWGVGLGSSFYVATRPEGTAWSNHMDADSRVRLRIGDFVYALEATRVSEAAERESVLDAYVAKYDADPAEMAGNAGLIYRLAAP